ncbi:MAG: tilS [Frankiales bacterium]|nr:tilS [Frankiales bacterium]
MGPHPAVAAVRRAVRLSLDELPGSDAVAVACSGGADSLALAAAVAFEAVRQGRPHALVTVDHGLQDGSALQARRVSALAYELGFDPVHTVTVEVGVAGGPEAAARSARYAALERAAGPDVPLLLGHTADDQAETVLLGLGRGSGPRSIAGMRPRHGRYLRPFLGLRRSQTQAACDALGLPYWDDPHNLDPAFTRVRLRREVLPLLENVLQGGVVSALARTADQLRDDAEVLDELSDRLLAAARSGDGLLVSALQGQPRALVSRALRSWCAEHSESAVTATQLGEIWRLVERWHGQAAIDLPGGARVLRASGSLTVQQP